ncbi:cysteine-rich CWC family protein [Polaromonas sp. P1(28)-13]|nr:cysteine-rich CWC family protein [Polaromonas sp. P1-6]UUZ70393.1 cysteine-rich CWC family protein [Polaromonas sp. P2-4]UUZ78387.1 cysteine-rich CWC family protein [Polaromonas sp. P1(28)-13]
MVAGDAECWCVQLPLVMPVPSSRAPDNKAASCFCPACLKLITHEQTRPGTPEPARD